MADSNTFDPDAYLAQKVAPQPAANAGVFDPDAYLAQKLAAPPRIQPAPTANAPGALAAAGRGFVQGGTLGFGDELGGAIQGALQRGTNIIAEGRKNGALGAGLGTKLLDALGIESRYGPTSVAETYRQGRDEMRTEDEEAQAAHPGAYLGGALAGSIATAKPVGALAEALPLMQGTRAARILKQGALLGGVAGLGATAAKTPGRQLLDALGVTGAEHAAQDIGGGSPGRALLDLAGAGALGGAGTVAATQAAAPLLRGLGSRLEQGGVGMAKRAIYNVTNGLAARKELSDSAAREALQSGAILPFGSAHGNAGRLADVAAQEGARLSGAIQTLEGAGVRVPADALVGELNNRAAALVPNTLVEQAPRVFSRMGEQVIDKMDPLTDTLGLGQTENLKRSAQGVAASAYSKMRPGEIGNAQKSAASVFRQAAEDAANKAKLGAVTGDPVDLAADDFLEAKHRLADLLPARNEAEVGAARGGRRSALGLVGQEMLGEGISSGDPSKAARSLGAALLNSVLHHRGPSTAATTAYWLGKAARQGGSLLGPALASPTAATVSSALQRGLDVGTSPLDYQQAMVDAIRSRKSRP